MVCRSWAPLRNRSIAEDRRRFGRLLDELKIRSRAMPQRWCRKKRLACGKLDCLCWSGEYVLGGRAMVIAYDVNTVQEYVAQAALMGPHGPC